MKCPLLLIIMDGFGITQDSDRSAITCETAPHLNDLFRKYPFALLEASGENVGLPAGQMGNSEVGHINIGAGRVIFQDLTRINSSIEDESFFENAVLKQSMLSAKKNNSHLHLLGLLSDGGAHSHIDHLFALLKTAKRLGLRNVYVHAFLDGRDASPKSGAGFIKKCETEMERIGVGKIGTIMGRFYAMDRDNRWERTQKAYDAIVCGAGICTKNPIAAVANFYNSGVTDEFIEPIICDRDAAVNAGDSVVFFNFRPDRACQLTRAFIDEGFAKFARRKDICGQINFVCMTRYSNEFAGAMVAFEDERLENTLGEVLSKNNLTQLRIAETEKYAHVTSFFNGGSERVYAGEDRILVPSPKVETYDLKPEMSTFEITEIVREKIKLRTHDVMVLNFANCDMVGHTGNFEATKAAVKTVDSCVYELVNEVLSVVGCSLITADHGNAEKMFDESGSPFTAHTTNPVPVCIVGHDCKLRSDGKLADIAPTVLDILNLSKPKEMSGESLIVR